MDAITGDEFYHRVQWAPRQLTINLRQKKVEFQIPNPVSRELMVCDQIPLDHCGPDSWDNVKDNPTGNMIRKEKLKGQLLADLQLVCNRQVKWAAECLHLTSAAIDQAYRRYWEQDPHPVPIRGRRFDIGDHRGRPWSLKDSQDPNPSRKKWHFRNTVISTDPNATKHVDYTHVILIGKKSVEARSRASAASSSKAKAEKDEKVREESPEEK